MSERECVCVCEVSERMCGAWKGKRESVGCGRGEREQGVRKCVVCARVRERKCGVRE